MGKDKAFCGNPQCDIQAWLVKQKTEDAVVSVSAADWAACCRHVLAVEQSY